jgi:type II secretory pathway pseudopilin PulG
MLDVHPPHAPTHTWRDFFIHIATIIVGLLIAIGLEQSVEAIHRAHERRVLQTALTHESEQILHDTTNVESGETAQMQYLRLYESQISDAARDHHPLPSPPPNPASVGWDVPDDPIYASAKSSGKLDLLSDEDVVAYGEQATLIDSVKDHYDLYDKARTALDTAFRRIRFAKPAGSSQFDHATPEDMKDLYDKVVDLEQTVRRFRYWSRQARGATIVMLQGERDLHRIEAAERQFDKLP